MNLIFLRLAFVSAIFLSLSLTVTAAGDVSSDGVWSAIDDASLRSTESERSLIPGDYRTFKLGKNALETILGNAPREFSNDASERAVILTLPMPDGSFQRFRIERSPIIEDGLAKKYPELARTYRGQGIDDVTATVRFDFLPTGFHSMILSSRGTVLVDPYFKSGDTENYISYRKSDAPKLNPFICEFEDVEKAEFLSDGFDEYFNGNDEDVTSGTQLRQYRLAVAATGEYTAVFRQAGDSDAQAKTRALEQQVLIMNRVNGVYERDLAIRMNIIANNDLLIYTDGATDPYTNSSGSTMLTENTNNLNTVIQTANYDIGHVFSTGGGGVATLNGPCGANKARGVTGLTNPVGDPFAIDYVAHEMGHQWGSNHTFNGAVSNCSGGNRSATNAYEPGSGVTIMAYAGICGNQDLARNSIDTFHVRSLEVIVAFSQTGGGNGCAATTASGNTPPTVSVVGGPSFNIPKQTPFTLTATGSDVNNDSLTYDWQEYNLGASTTAVPNTDSDGVAKPIFRSYLPTTSGARTFPSLPYILNNANVPPSTFSCNRATPCLIGELLPAITRSMAFQVIARDNRANAGGINTATATVAVDGNSGPFAVTSPNTAVSIAANSVQTITWSVANTTAAPVSATNVKITLSTDGGQTFPNVLVASTPNDGSDAILIPNIPTTTARIKVEAVGNIFFDISDTNFTITSASATGRRFVDFDGDAKTDISIFRPSVSEWWYLRSSDGGNRAFQFGTSTDTLTPGDFTGDGKTDLAFYRASAGTWYVFRSENATFYSFPFGAANDVPAPGDFDGDGKTDAAVFRPSNSTWYIQNSGGGTTIQAFGAANDKPVAADYDGDGKDDIAIYRPGSGQWWLNRSTAGIIAVTFGTSTDKTVQGDYTGDGKADLAFFRNGEWFVLRSENSTFYSFPFGISTDTPVPGDYDGDGKFDGAVYRSSNNTWYVQRSTAGTLIQAFGAAGDIAVPNAFVR
ncbi:MAG: VCBS repeat-containing protein [Acidobacteria bacterium]|nr:VCBS repeat-containing protein [Acidobacteriota bacterium]